MATTALTVAPIAPAIGAEITGIDLRVADDAALDALRRAIHEHLAVFVRHQDLSLDDLVALTDRLGGQGDTPFLHSVDGYPGVVRVVKEASEVKTLNFGGAWHSDWSFQPAPPSLTLLHAAEIPPAGGDTLWSNQYLAYETLSPGLRATLDGLRAVHSAGWAYSANGVLARTAGTRSMQIDTTDDALAEHEHPVVVTHPDTGRRALFLNPTYTVRFAGWTAAESKPLLDHLYAHSTRPEFVCRFRWSERVLAIWDNRVTQHLALNDYDGFRRELFRTTVAGTVPA